MIPIFLVIIISFTTTITPLKHNFSSHLSLSNPQPSSMDNYKKLRRLPHVFSKVLELPFDSDADVYIQEQPDCFRFVADLDDHDVDRPVKAHVIEVHPGITKVVIRFRREIILDELHLDVWRIRLPQSARPELATAVYAHGQLIVIVPKYGWCHNINKVGDSNSKGGFKSNMGNLVLVR